jgi:pimeloyl-ACP methyl ester carboxylesterase
MKTIKSLIAILVLFSGHCIHAQQKGSFNNTVSFMSENRTLSCYVPPDYDSTQQYGLLICLHGLGDNSTNYRNALVNSLGWPSIFANTIIICPDGGEDANSDFYAPQGDQEIIQSCIGFAKQNYTIDSNDILLQGFSLGGRSALKYGLEHHDQFKGLLLNTPAMQGMLDVENSPIGSLDYDYENASLIPIYTTVGTEDYFYLFTVTKLIEILKRNNGVVDFAPVAGMAHSIPTQPTTLKAAAFLNNSLKADYDLDMFAIDGKDRYCSDIQAKCLVRNMGNTPVNSIKLNISYGSISTTHTWTGSLSAYQHAEISLPGIAGANGVAKLKVSIAEINTSEVDPEMINDSLSKQIEVAKENAPVLVEEGFEAENPLWITPNDGNIFNWYLDAEIKKSGESSLAAFNTPLLFYTKGATVDVLSPAFDISSATAPTLSFDLAFNYLHYTPPYVSVPYDYADTLEILITTDCGQSFTSIYKKGGAQLATAVSPIVNPLSIEQCFFTPQADEWRKEIIDLTPYIGNDNAYVKFNYISAMGGSIYVDNARIGEGMPTGIDDTKQPFTFGMYPNPANDKVTITLNDTRDAKVTIYDSLGKMVMSKSAENALDNQFSLDLTQLENGFYVIETGNGSQKATKKLLINR